MEVKIGIQMAPRELVVDTSASVQEIQDALTSALTEGTLFVIKDAKKGPVLIPADKVAYVEFDLTEPRRVGFGST